MAIVLQSSWFWLAIIATLVTIAGCVVLFRHQSAQETSTQTSASQITVTPAYMPPDTLQFSTNLHLFNPISTLIPRFGTSPPPDDDLVIHSARCYQLANSGYSCLGEVFNAGNDNFGRLSLQYRDNTGTNQVISTTEQRLLPSNATVPYRLLIPPDTPDIAPQRDGIVDFSVNSSLIRAYPPAPNIRHLTVSEAHGQLTDTGLYLLQLTIFNQTNFSARDVRVITTLRGNEWGVVGYQVYEVGEIVESGTYHLLNVEIIPNALPDSIEHIIHVEGMVDH